MSISDCLSCCFRYFLEDPARDFIHNPMLRPSEPSAPNSPLEFRLATPLPQEEEPTESTPLCNSYISPPDTPS